MDKKSEINPFILRKVVLPQNTDHAGVMWHGSYLLWLEEARINALSNVGLNYWEISEQGFEMPVVELKIDYMSPLFHGDEVLLKSFIAPGKGPRWKWKTSFFKFESKPAALAEVDLVIIKKNNSGNSLVRKGPTYLMKALEKLQLGLLH